MTEEQKKAIKGHSEMAVVSHSHTDWAGVARAARDKEDTTER